MKVSSRQAVVVVVAMLTLAAAVSVFATIHKFRNIPFPWDPAAYASDGLILARDLKTLDLVSFLGDTYRLGWRPFLHAWMLAPSFIVLGNTATAARLVSLLCLVLLIPVLYRACLEAAPRHGHWAGLITVSLALTSLPFLVLSAMCMEEVPGTLMTFLALVFYLRALNSGKGRFFVWTSVFMAATLFTKWHHGVFVVMAVALTQLTRGGKIFSKENARLFLPFAVAMAGWFAYPRHIAAFFGHSTFQPRYYEFWSLENLLYYPKSLLSIYHASVVVAAVMALCFLSSLRFIKDPKTRALAMHVLIGLVLMTIKLDNRHRYILPIVPSIWILGSTELTRLIQGWRRLIRRPSHRLALSAAGGAGLLVILALTVPKLYSSYPTSLQKYEFAADERQNAAYAYIARHAGDHQRLIVFGAGDYYNSLKGATIRWHLEVARDGQAARIEQTRKLTRFYLSQLVRRRNRDAFRQLVDFWEHKDIQVIEGHLLSFVKQADPDAYRRMRERKQVEPFSDKIVDVDSLGATATCLITLCREGEGELNGYAERFLASCQDWKLSCREGFPDLGLTVTIYERDEGPAAYRRDS